MRQAITNGRWAFGVDLVSKRNATGQACVRGGDHAVIVHPLAEGLGNITPVIVGQAGAARRPFVLGYPCGAYRLEQYGYTSGDVDGAFGALVGTLPSTGLPSLSLRFRYAYQTPDGAWHAAASSTLEQMDPPTVTVQTCLPSSWVSGLLVHRGGIALAGYRLADTPTPGVEGWTGNLHTWTHYGGHETTGADALNQLGGYPVGNYRGTAQAWEVATAGLVSGGTCSVVDEEGTAAFELSSQLTGCYLAKLCSADEHARAIDPGLRQFAPNGIPTDVPANGLAPRCVPESYRTPDVTTGMGVFWLSFEAGAAKLLGEDPPAGLTASAASYTPLGGDGYSSESVQALDAVTLDHSGLDVPRIGTATETQGAPSLFSWLPGASSWNVLDRPGYSGSSPGTMFPVGGHRSGGSGYGRAVAFMRVSVSFGTLSNVPLPWVVLIGAER